MGTSWNRIKMDYKKIKSKNFIYAPNLFQSEIWRCPVKDVKSRRYREAT